MGITAIGGDMTILRHSQVKKQVSMCNSIFRCNFWTFMQLFTNLKIMKSIYDIVKGIMQDAQAELHLNAMLSRGELNINISWNTET